MRTREELVRALHEVMERIEAYAGGDRPQSPPVGLLREERTLRELLHAMPVKSLEELRRLSVAKINARRRNFDILKALVEIGYPVMLLAQWADSGAGAELRKLGASSTYGRINFKPKG